MSWEARGESSYYYRVARGPTGRLVKSFLGRGPAAAAAAREDAEARAARDADREAARALEAELEPLDALADELDAGVTALVEACLRSAGLRKHHGEWRPLGRRRESSASS